MPDWSVERKGAGRPRHAVTAEALGRRILGGDLQPGTVLPNAERLALEYRVSRPALREAIKLLAGKGLLEMAPRRGTVVRPKEAWSRLDDDVITWQLGEAPDAHFVRNLFELRRMIEPEAAALAAIRVTQDGLSRIENALTKLQRLNFASPDSVQADLDFHRAILTQTGNEFLAAFAPAIEAHLRVTFNIQRRSSAADPRYLKDHNAVFLAIRDRDAAAARVASLALLDPSENDAIAGLAESAA